MLAYKRLEDYDDFGDVVVCWVDVTNVPEEFVREAGRIDGKYYSGDCFGVCLQYDREKNGFAVVDEVPGCHLYYVDNAGRRHWFGYKLDGQEVELFAGLIRLEIEGHREGRYG